MYAESIKDVSASIIGSALCVYTGQPFDTIKVRIQCSPETFVNPLTCLRRTISEEGVLALWKGSIPALMGALSENAMAFGVNGIILRSLSFLRENKQSELSIYKSYISGAITGAFTASVLCPCDVLKCRAQMLQLQSGSHTQIKLKNVFLDIYRIQGIRGVFIGYQAQTIRDILFYATFFGSYDSMTNYCKNNWSLNESTVYLLCGGIAGQIGWLASIVPDTIKSRIQTSSLNNIPKINQVAKDIYLKQGIRGFFSGVGVAVIRAFPANAALFLGYELSRKAMNNIL